MKMKKIVSFFLVLISLAGLLSFLPARALEDPEIDPASSAVLYHNESGTVIYRRENSALLPVGPAARLTAALIYAENYKNRTDKTVTVNKKVTGAALSTLNPGLKTGEELPVYDLLCAMLVANSDDAVYALAYDLFENEENPLAAMVAEMNRRARAAGMKNTVFTDLIGKETDNDDAAGCTAIDDLLILALEVQKSSLLTEICALKEYRIADTNKTTNREKILTRNYMLSAMRIPGYTYAPVTGLASQKGAVSGHSAVITAQFAGKHFTCVVYGSREDDYGAFKDAKALLEWGNKNFSYKKVLDETAILGEVRVTLSGDSDYIAVAPKESVSAFLPNDLAPEEEITVRVNMSFTELTAPVPEGLIAGKALVLYRGKELSKVDLVTIGSLSQSNNRYYYALLRNFLSSKAFIMICIGLVLLFAVYVLISARVRYLRQKRPSALVFDDADEKAPPLISAPENEQIRRDAPEKGAKELNEPKKSDEKKNGVSADEKAKENGAHGAVTPSGASGQNQKPRPGKAEEQSMAASASGDGFRKGEENKNAPAPKKRQDVAPGVKPAQKNSGKGMDESAEKGAATGVGKDASATGTGAFQQNIFEDGAADDLLVFGSVAKEGDAKEGASDSAKPRNDYVPEGWGKPGKGRS